MTNEAMDGLSAAELRLLLLIERRLEQRLRTRLDGKLAAIARRIDQALAESEMEDVAASESTNPDDDNDDYEDHQPRAEGA
jgi:hypothetical protein